MIVAAIDVSSSTAFLEGYNENIHRVLSSLSPPIRVIHWNDEILKDEIYDSIDKSMSEFKSDGNTAPKCFMEILPNDDPIELYIFTDGEIMEAEVDDCRLILNDGNKQLSKVHLYYIGDEIDMNLRFTDVFKGILQEIHINDDYIGHIEPNLPDFDEIDYDFIMKDDTFKATILSQINSSDVDKTQLKIQLNKLTTRILKNYFKDKFTIGNFFAEQDIEGCVSFVRKHSYSLEKINFQRKMSDIMKLFDENTDTYSLSHFKKVEKYTLELDNDDSMENEEIQQIEEVEPIECEYLTCDILYEKCQVGCIPVKTCRDDIWMNKKILNNPFKLLESEELVQRITNTVEPYVLDYKNAYAHLETPDVSPFTRDELKGVYVLHNDKIDVQAMFKHNNYVLGTLFQNRLPGKSVIWHMIFLYILAMKRFQDKKALLFEEIRFLGEHAKYFVSLSPFLNPPIIDSLNCCFWYIACVCPKAFPNSKKNILRKADFVSGVFLKFYQDVYDENYTNPEMSSWQLWYTLCCDKLAIFPILSNYYHHEKVDGLESSFQIILYRNKKHPDSKPAQYFEFLSQLNLEKVLNIYAKFIEQKSLEYYADLKVVKEQKIVLYDANDENEEDFLSHVKINPATCHPYVNCPITGKYWRDCIGDYNEEKKSYVRLFKRYCEKYNEYPQNSENLMCFLNQFIFRRKGEIPELFSLSLRDEMDKIMKIFEEVMGLKSCEEYLKCSNSIFNEDYRRKYECNPVPRYSLVIGLLNAASQNISVSSLVSAITFLCSRIWSRLCSALSMLHLNRTYPEKS